MEILSSYLVTEQPYISPVIDGRVIVHRNPDDTLGFTWQGGDIVALTGEAIDSAMQLGILKLDRPIDEQGKGLTFGPFQLVTIEYDYLRDWLIARRKR